MSRYKVIFSVAGKTHVIVDARCEEEAEVKAQEKIDLGWTLDDGDIEDIWDIIKLPEAAT